MNRSNVTMNMSALCLALGLAACGGSESDVHASLDVPEIQDRTLALHPALDVSGLYDPAIADRIVIEEIKLHVADVRLLGRDPRLPVAGLPLLASGVVLEAYDGEIGGLELAIPTNVAEDDLAVYIRVDRTAALGNASVVVKGRMYAKALTGGAGTLTAESEDDSSRITTKRDEKKGLDPDGDPADDPEEMNNPMCGLDPDGDPANCARKKLVSRGEQQESVPFELRGVDVADLITSLDVSGLFDVVIGIPASRWFTPEAVEQIDQQLRGTEEQIVRDGAVGGADRGAVLLNRNTDKTETARGMSDEDYNAEGAREGFNGLKTGRPMR